MLQGLSDPLETEITMPLEDYMACHDLINEALNTVKGTRNISNVYPDYFDDILQELIDAVPLE